MKKLLALVLALVMTLGLATVAANASYPDDSDIEYKEAVDVMSAVGVFQGDDSGKFMPKANLDRAAAAKLIAYLDLGEKSAEALPAAKMFNDVPASHWAAKYIAYCANAGYIAGAGDGNFYPSNPLTGYAFGKMILGVLGYDAAIEGFTGAAWAINVAKLMDKNDINDGVDGNASATLTREQAAKYCLNALQADMVEYDTKGTTVEINGAKIATGASKATEVAEKKDMYDGNNDGVQQLTEKLYGTDLKLLPTTKSDDFGAPAVEWKYKTESVGTYADSPDATYTGKVTKGTIYTLVGKNVADDLDKGNAKMEVYVDGALDGSYATKQAVKNSTGKAFGTDKGMVTEVYIDDDGVNGDYALVTVVVKNTYVMQATGDYNSKTEKIAVKDLSNKAKKTSLNTDDFDEEVLSSLKEDDYILYTFANGDIQTIEKAQVVKGNVDSWKSDDSVTIAGTKYSYSVQSADKGTQYTVNDTAKVVLDAQGNIIAVDEVSESNDDVVYVKQIAKNGFDFQAKIVTIEGKKLTVNIDDDSTWDSADDKEIYYNTDSDNNLGKFLGFMNYDVQSDGSYELSYYDKKAESAASTSIKLNKNTGLVSGYTANSSTVYIVEDEDGDITLYTGVRNAPDKVNFSAASKAYATYNKDSELVYVYVNADDSVEDSSSTNDQQIFVLEIKNKTITDSNKKKYYEVKALVDGVEKTLNVADGKTPFEVGKLYKNTKTDSNGYINGATLVSSDYDTFEFTNTNEPFKYDDETFTFTGSKAKIDSRLVKTDKVYVVVAAGDLLDDPDADWEIAEVSTFDQLADFDDGYKISANGYILLNDDETDEDSEIVAAYIWISASTEL